MQIERKKLGSLAWYRLTKVVYFVLVSIWAIGAILLAFAELYVGIGLLVTVGLIAEIIRQVFFYVVTGVFLSKKYKEKLMRIGKVLVGILIVVLVIFLGIKAVRAIGASMCNSKLGELGSYESGNCECIYGYSLENDSCVSNDTICQKTLGENAISIGEVCECKTGYSIINGSCVETDDICAEQFGNAEGVLGEDKCVCKSGYRWNDKNDYCIKIEIPKPPEVKKEKCAEHGFKAVYNAMSDTCDCKYDYVKIDGICQDPPYCGQNAHYDEQKKCICDFGFEKVGDRCEKPDCPLNSSYNSDTDKCQCNSSYLVRNGQCKSAIELCGLLGKYNTSTENCVECGFGDYVKGRNCVPEPYCGMGGEFNAKTEQCVCSSRFVKQSDGTCSFDFSR